MKLQFEKWLDIHPVSPNAMELFAESLKSYKAGAYKASLLYSYLAFMTIVKERILIGSLPPGIAAGDWTGIQNRVVDVEHWDTDVFNAIQKQQPAPVFPITETIRREVIYWKDRRNDCAHFKHSKIDYHHVESLWLFIENNLGKFAVNGGKAALLKKFQDHFDAAITRPGLPFEHLIAEIASSVEVAELPAFFASISTQFDDLIDETQYLIFNAIFTQYSNHIAEALKSYLKTDSDRLLAFIRLYPERIALLDLDPAAVRRLWHNELFTTFQNDYEVYGSLIQNNLLQPADYQEAHTTIFGRSSARSNTPGIIQAEILQNAGYYLNIKPKLFPPGGHFTFAFGNSCAGMTIHYLQRFPVDVAMTTSLNNSFRQAYPPRELKAKLNSYLVANPDKKAEFITLIMAEHLQIAPEMNALLH